MHQVLSLVKQCLLGTHQGAVTPAHLDCYLDEFTFRFNRRTSRYRGKLFYPLAQQAVAVDPRRTTRSSGKSGVDDGGTPDGPF